MRLADVSTTRAEVPLNSRVDPHPGLLSSRPATVTLQQTDTALVCAASGARPGRASSKASARDQWARQSTITCQIFTHHSKRPT